MIDPGGINQPASQPSHQGSCTNGSPNKNAIVQDTDYLFVTLSWPVVAVEHRQIMLKNTNENVAERNKLPSEWGNVPGDCPSPSIVKPRPRNPRAPRQKMSKICVVATSKKWKYVSWGNCIHNTARWRKYEWIVVFPEWWNHNDSRPNVEKFIREITQHLLCFRFS